MSEAKHTPGPWKMFWANDNQTGLPPYTIGCPSGFPLAELVRPDPRIGGDLMANARLIAAAPDLLAACLFALDASTGTASDTLRAIRAAVAKATAG